MVTLAKHPSTDTGSICDLSCPDAAAICDPKVIHPASRMLDIPPTAEPIVFAQGTNIPRVNIPKAVPLVIDVIALQTLKMPRKYCSRNTRRNVRTPWNIMLDLISRVATLSLGCLLKNPRTMSSRNTREIVLKHDESELRPAPNIPAINKPGIP